MQRFCNNFDNLCVSSTEGISGSRISKLEEAKNNLVRVLLKKISNNLYIVRGKDKGKDCHHQVLVDWDKKKQFLEKIATNSVDVANYGKILSSGWGHDVPQYDIKQDQVINSFKEKFLLLRLQQEGCEKTYYVEFDDEKGYEMVSASSKEEIESCGRILYSSSDEDPPEALVHVIEEQYFGIAEQNRNIDSRSFDAARKGDLQKVRDYLEEGGDLNSTDYYGWSMLHHAAHCGNMDIIELLKEKGANMLEDKMCGRKPVHIAVRESHNSVILFFLKNGAHVNERDQNNWTLLHYAAWKGDLKTFKLLIQEGAEINAEDASMRKKPIHVAAEYGHNDVIKVLLENKANIEDSDEGGRTPLYYAAWTGHLETAKYLIGQNADVNMKTKFGTTNMHAVIHSKRSKREMIEFFLDSGLNIDERNLDGCTPLHYAVDFGNLNVVQLLVDRGANLSAVDKYGNTPLVESKKHVNVLLYLTDTIGKQLQDQGKYSEALNVYKESLEILKEKLGYEHAETLEISNKIGVMLYELGRYDEAMVTFKDVLQTREGCLGSNHFETLSMKYRMGLVYNAQIKYSEAMEIFKEVFDNWKNSLGADDDCTLNVSRDIGYLHFKKGDYEEAFKIFEEVFEKRKTHFGADHPKTLTARQDMAVVLVNKGDYKLALQIFKDILEKRRTSLGNSHADTLATGHHISVISQKFEKELQQGCVII